MSIFFLTLLFAFLLDGLLGDPHTAWHPVALVGRMAAWIECGMRRLCGDGIASGFAAWLLMMLPVPAVYFAVRGAEQLHIWCGIVLAGILLYFCIALRSLIDHAQAVRIPLERGDLVSARRALGMIVSRDTGSLDACGVIRGAIESLGENGIDAVNSALFWCAVGYLVCGLPGLAAGAVFLRLVNTLDACWGYRNERYEKFGKFAARADDLAHWIPARLTMIAVAFGALFCGGSFFGAVRTGIRHRKDHPSPNSCWGMASFAGALGIRLGGPTVYGGELENYPYWGDGRSELTVRDLIRAEYLTVCSSAVFTAFIFTGAGIWMTARLWF